MRYRKIDLSDYWISNDSWFKISLGSGRDGMNKVSLPNILPGENLLISCRGFRPKYKITKVRNLTLGKNGLDRTEMKFQWDKIEFVNEDWGRTYVHFFINYHWVNLLFDKIFKYKNYE